VAGQQRLKAALLACAVDPAVGGVLVRGEKGTGKTTLVRGLAELLPPIRAVKGCPYHCDPENPETVHRDCAEAVRAAQAGERKPPEAVEIPVPVTELPLGATEERVAGSLQLEETLESGERRFEPGLLAAANRGILYVDEVNLLEDHLVDLVLDAAATGVNRVEREGFSLEHPADFVPVGTMNPEEGELRPQFLDRFGLCISIRGEEDPAVRKEIIRRRMAYEEDRRGFAERWSGEQERLRNIVVAARELRLRVELAEELWDLIVEIAAAAGVQGHRADIVMARTAVVLAALNGRAAAEKADVLEAARLALPHRIAGDVDATPESESERLEGLIAGFDARSLAEARQAAREEAQEEARNKSAGGDAERVGGETEPGARGGASGYTETAGVASAASGAEGLEELQVPGAAAAGSIVFDFLEKKSPR
jgi:Mg-chelatase subunit ChlI